MPVLPIGTDLTTSDRVRMVADSRPLVVQVSQGSYERFKVLLGLSSDPEAFANAIGQKLMEECEIWLSANFDNLVEDLVLPSLPGF